MKVLAPLERFFAGFWSSTLTVSMGILSSIFYTNSYITSLGLPVPRIERIFQWQLSWPVTVAYRNDQYVLKTKLMPNFACCIYFQSYTIKPNQIFESIWLVESLVMTVRLWSINQPNRAQTHWVRSGLSPVVFMSHHAWLSHLALPCRTHCTTWKRLGDESGVRLSLIDQTLTSFD